MGRTLKDARSSFLPAFLPRLLAVFCVVSLIGVLSLTCILGIALIGPALSHGASTNHAAGQIVMIGPGKDFVLLTTTGQRLVFQCGGGCRASLGHLQRHLREHAHTDVYYIAGPNKMLMALDVD
jgi:hypothetical protein